MFERNRKQHLRCGLVFCAVVFYASAFSAVAGEPQRGAATGTVEMLHYWTGALGGGVQDMVDTFNRENLGSDVSATGFEHESFKGGILSRLSSGKGPDIFSYWAGAKVQALVDAGYLDPLDGLWKNAEVEQCFAPSVAAACVYNGHKYAVPVTQHVVMFFYNKKVFLSLGLTPPKTWDAFLDVCQRIKASGITPIAIGTKERWPAQFWFDYLLLRTAGPAYRQDLMNGKKSYTDPEVKRAFSLWGRLLEMRAFNDAPEKEDWAGAAVSVRNGQAAMTLMGTWIIGHYSGDLAWNEGTDYDFFTFPVIDEAVPMVALGPIDVLLKSKGGKVDEVQKALAYFAGVKPQEAMSRGSGALAPNICVPDAFYSQMKRRIRVAMDASPHWAFNYDLATPPLVADVGLGCFSAFMKQPDRLDALLRSTQQRAESCFVRSMQ